tara:strand:+ start:5378 stop:5788 length:411 start_codon:yes stop_codon:yes gene_type:complete
MDCIFCKIASKEIPAKILVETDSCLGLLDAFPLARGHALVIPKNHYEKIQNMPKELNIELFTMVHELIPKIDSLTGSTLVAIHNGKESGQEIPHVHVHLIPRSKTDSAGAVHSMFKNDIKLTDVELSELCQNLKIG